GLLNTCHHCRGGSLCVIAPKSVTGAFDYDELCLYFVLLERVIDPLAVAQWDQFVLVTMNQQRRRIVRSDEEYWRVIRSLRLVEVQRRKALSGSAPWRGIDSSRDQPQIDRRKIRDDRSNSIALLHEILFGRRDRQRR